MNGGTTGSSEKRKTLSSGVGACKSSLKSSLSYLTLLARKLSELKGSSVFLGNLEIPCTFLSSAQAVCGIGTGK